MTNETEDKKDIREAQDELPIEFFMEKFDEPNIPPVEVKTFDSIEELIENSRRVQKMNAMLRMNALKFELVSEGMSFDFSKALGVVIHPDVLYRVDEDYEGGLIKVVVLKGVEIVEPELYHENEDDENSPLGHGYGWRQMSKIVDDMIDIVRIHGSCFPQFADSPIMIVGDNSLYMKQYNELATLFFGRSQPIHGTVLLTDALMVE